MFIRTVIVKGHSYVRLVESYRQNGKVKQRYIATICSQEQLDINSRFLEPIVDFIADLLKDHTDLGEVSIGTKKETARMIKARAADLLDDYIARVKSRNDRGNNG
jgi:hypothetical protein